MKGCRYWSYSPYRPPLFEVGEIYICRVAPSVDTIHIEWLCAGCEEYEVYCRVRSEGEFALCGVTRGNEFDIVGLSDETDYEFFVSSKDKKSRVRLARCGRSVGTTVNYLHPKDETYVFSGRYLCSPSLVRHPDGYLLASMDLFEGGKPQNLTLIFRSDDDGESWHYVSELMPCFWGKMFIHKGELYMLSVSTEYGDLLIGKSIDGGKTFSAPVCLLRGSNGKGGNSGVHKNPQNIVIYNNRLYTTFEWGAWQNTEYSHAAAVMSCNVDDDLLNPENWSFSEPRKFAHFAPEVSEQPLSAFTIEGTLAVDPEGRLVNMMRFQMFGLSLVYQVNTEDHEAPLSYLRLMEFPANYSKFMIKKDEESGCYYSVGTRVNDWSTPHMRNLLSLLRSRDLVTWEIVCDLLDYTDKPKGEVGFQYVDFEFDGEDIIYLCRTAINGANNFHDSNYSTFHRIKNFREL